MSQDNDISMAELENNPAKINLFEVCIFITLFVYSYFDTFIQSHTNTKI